MSRTNEITLPPSVATELVKHLTLARFSKCGGDLYKHSRRFPNLDKMRKAYALDLIATGIEPSKAITRAKRYEVSK